MSGKRPQFAQARKMAGHTQESLAEHLEVDRTTVARWELGDTEPLPYIRPRLAVALRVTLETLAGLLTENADGASQSDIHPATPDPETEDVERRELLQHLATLGISISPAAHALEAIQVSIGHTFEGGDHHISHWEEITGEYGYAYLAMPPKQFIIEVAADLVSLRLITRHIAHDAAVYKDWCRIGSTLSGLMAKALSNVGHTREARHWWQTAQTASDRSGDLDTRLWVRSQRLIHGLYEQRPPGLLVRQADAAIGLAQNHACAGLVETSQARAQGLVLAGDPTAAEEELARAEQIQSRLPAGVTGDFDSVHGMGEDRLRYTETWVYAHSGQIAKADAAAQRAMQLYPSSDHRSPAQIKLLQAFARTKAGDVTEGIRHAQATYETLPPAHRTTMVTNLAKRVLRPIPSDAQSQPVVSAYRELVSLPASAGRRAIEP
jgi:transcriptional regulator with XRE-family HTH domain